MRSGINIRGHKTLYCLQLEQPNSTFSKLCRLILPALFNERHLQTSSSVDHVFLGYH